MRIIGGVETLLMINNQGGWNKWRSWINRGHSYFDELLLHMLSYTEKKSKVENNI